MTADESIKNVVVQTQAWQVKWVVFKILRFVCKHFHPFFPSPFPLFYLHHFLSGLWLSLVVFVPNRTETLATQANRGHVMTSFMSHHQELLVSFFQSKETRWNGHVTTCTVYSVALILIFLTVPTQTTYKISFSFDVNDGKTTNMKISSPVPVE